MMQGTEERGLDLESMSVVIEKIGVIAAAAMRDAATEVATATERETGNGDITGIIVMIENITAMNDDTGRDLYREIEIIVGGRDPVKGVEKAEVPVLTISIVGQEEVTPQMMIVDLIDEVAEIEVTAGDIDVNPCIFMLLAIMFGIAAVLMVSVII